VHPHFQIGSALRIPCSKKRKHYKMVKIHLYMFKKIEPTYNLHPNTFFLSINVIYYNVSFKRGSNP